MSSSENRSSKAELSLPRLRWSWDFGPLLADVDATRLLTLLSSLAIGSSLRDAANKVDLSYRSAWGLLRDCELALGTPLVIMQRGRGTSLTAFGESIVALDNEARQALDVVHAPWQRRLGKLMAPVVRPVPERLRLEASHDLALADWIEHGRRISFNLFWRGTEEALDLLGRDECDIAGFHVPEDWTSAQLTSWLGQWLKPAQHICVPLMRRCQGLMLARGNPYQLHTLADLSREGLRMVNRQRGSGTRRLIDQLLAAAGLQPENLAGYAHEEFTHEAVAATVAGGQVDVGFGIEAAAMRYDLGFIPLVWERYGFAMRSSVADSPEGKQLLKRLQGSTFRHRLLSLPGYEPLPVRVQAVWDDFIN